MSDVLAHDIPIIRYAIGDRSYEVKAGVARHYTDGPASQLAELAEYYVELPDYFAHGFPNRWNFSIIRVKGDEVDDILRGKLVNKITRIIDTHSMLMGIPVLFISTTDAFQVADELPPKRLNIFDLEVDDDDLTASRQAAPVPPHLSPLISAIRRSLTGQQWQEFWLSPYRRSTPANGWRFFGRRKELRKITETLDNFVVVGARRIGKTSLLQELTRILQKQGYAVYNIDTQFSRNERDLTNKLITTLDPHMAASLTRRQEVVTTSMLESALRHLAGQRKAALLIDEIGNLLAGDQNEAWKTMGTIRSYVHRGNIKLICTASQTFLLKQQQDYSGPWVNFATTLLLRGLTLEETHDFILTPLKIWRPMAKEECDEVFDLIYNNVGSHPLLLTAFCEALFARVVGGDAKVKIVTAARDLMKGKDDGISKAIGEVFFSINRPVIQYLFLQHCLERHDAQERLMHSIISESWINFVLQKAGYKSRLATRLFLLEALNTRALTEPDLEREDQCRVIAPFIYNHSRLHMRLEAMRDALRDEIALDAEEYQLVKA